MTCKPPSRYREPCVLFQRVAFWVSVPVCFGLQINCWASLCCCVAVKLCPALCDPVDRSTPGSPPFTVSRSESVIHLTASGSAPSVCIYRSMECTPCRSPFSKRHASHMSRYQKHPAWAVISASETSSESPLRPWLASLVPACFQSSQHRHKHTDQWSRRYSQLDWICGSKFLLLVPLTLTNPELPEARLGVLWDATTIIMLQWYAREPGQSVLTYFLVSRGGIGWCEAKSRVTHAFPLRFLRLFQGKFSKAWLMLYILYLKLCDIHSTWKYLQYIKFQQSKLTCL